MSRGDCRAAPCSTQGTAATSKRDMSCPTATKLSGRWRWAEGQRGPPGSSHANVPALHPSPHPPPGSTFPFSCLSPAEKTNTPEIRAILAEPREQSPLSETRGCLPKPRARQMGETALSGSPSQGHMSYYGAHECRWLSPSREAAVWWPAFPAGLGAASLHQATGTSTCSYLCQPSTRTHGSGTIPGHRALPTALFPRKPLEIISCPAPAAPGTGPGSSYPAPTSGQRSRAWKHRGNLTGTSTGPAPLGAASTIRPSCKSKSPRNRDQEWGEGQETGPPSLPSNPTWGLPTQRVPGHP